MQHPFADGPIDHALLTVGLSELPVLISAHRLCLNAHRKSQRLPHLHYVCTQRKDAGSSAEAVRVHELLRKKLEQGGCSTANLQHSIRELEQASNPWAVYQNIAKLMDRLGNEAHVHLNYTGGKGSMAAGCLRALIERQLRTSAPCSTSYLSIDDSALFFEKEDRTDTPDEREHLKLTLEELTLLHGWRVHSERTPDPDLVDASVKMTEELAGDVVLRKTYMTWKFGGYAQDFPAFSEQTVAALSSTTLLNPYLAHTGDAWRVSAPKNSPAYQFFQDRCLELAAYDALKQAQANLGLSLDVRHSFETSPINGNPNKFEVDLVTLKGYELLGISCSNTMVLKSVKSKAMEVLHRMRTIGGIGARTIVLCMLQNDDRDRLEQSLKDDLGGRDYNVKLMTYTRHTTLVKEFESYMLKLKWA